MDYSNSELAEYKMCQLSKQLSVLGLAIRFEERKLKHTEKVYLKKKLNKSCQFNDRQIDIALKKIIQHNEKVNLLKKKLHVLKKQFEEICLVEDQCIDTEHLV